MTTSEHPQSDDETYQLGRRRGLEEAADKIRERATAIAGSNTVKTSSIGRTKVESRIAAAFVTELELLVASIEKL